MLDPSKKDNFQSDCVELHGLHTYEGEGELFKKNMNKYFSTVVTEKVYITMKDKKFE